MDSIINALLNQTLSLQIGKPGLKLCVCACFLLLSVGLVNRFCLLQFGLYTTNSCTWISLQRNTLRISINRFSKGIIHLFWLLFYTKHLQFKCINAWYLILRGQNICKNDGLFQRQSGIQILDITKIKWIDFVCVKRFWHFHHFDSINGTGNRACLAFESDKVSASPVGRLVGFSMRKLRNEIKGQKIRIWLKWLFFIENLLLKNIMKKSFY